VISSSQKALFSRDAPVFCVGTATAKTAEPTTQSIAKNFIFSNIVEEIEMGMNY
jgi:hypothetical protein